MSEPFNAGAAKARAQGWARMSKPRRSNKMPKDFAKRISTGLKLWWLKRKKGKR